MAMHTDIYDELAPALVAKGLRPVPIGPGTKTPCVWLRERGEYVPLPDWQIRPPITAPQPGAGVGVVMGRGIVALDLDEDDIAIALLDILPDTPCRKLGQRGETLFYRAPPELHSQKFKINGKCVVEILYSGTQTVLPPTVHPAGTPYRWTGPRTLLEVDAGNDLPLLPADIVEQIEAVLSRFGYNPQPTHDHVNGASSDTPFRALNEEALHRLAAWVAALDIYGCRRRRGQHASYEAVASWRPSSSGRELPLRKRNLSISPKGIKDFGDGRTYTPIDLVMAARECAFKDAVAFLDEKLGWSAGGPDINIDSNEPKAEDAGAAGAKDAGTAEARDTGTASRRYRFKLTSFADLRPGSEPLYRVDELIPIAGIVVAWGKPKCLKSFWTLDLMLHVAMGWEYRDRSVQQGTVVYCAFEGAHGYKKRVEALRRHYAIAEDASVPLYVMPGQANLIKEHKLLISDTKAQLGDVIPAAVVLDTLNKSLHGSESKDEDMGQYIRAAEAIRDAFGCVVIIVHHCGYDDTHPRGHTSLPGTVDAQLAVTRLDQTVTVTVEHMRDGPEDTAVTSVAQPVEVGYDKNGKPLTSLVLVAAEAAPFATERAKWPLTLATFHKAMQEAVAAHGRVFYPDGGILPVQAVDLEAVRNRFYDRYAVGEPDEAKKQGTLRQAFHRGLNTAQQRGLIAARNVNGRTMVWFADPA
jgi:hypothetical protein